MINGTEGSIQCYDDREYSLVLDKRGEKDKFLSTDEMLTHADPTVGTGKTGNSGVIDEFVECIRNGAACRCTGWEAIKAMRAVFAAFESARTGRMIGIPENM